MNEIEKSVLKYLASRDSDWKWVMGVTVYDKEQTIKLFKKDKKFRKFIVEEILKLATDLFVKSGHEKR